MFERIKYLSISTRISILLGAIIILTMGAFSTFSLIKQKEDAIASIDNNTAQLSQTIEKILRVSMLKNRREDISSAIKNIVGSEGIQSIMILNHKGVIKFSSRKDEINLSIPQSDNLCTGCHGKEGGKSNYNLKDFRRFRIDEDNNIIYSSLPIYNAPECYNGVCHSTGEENNSSGSSLKRLVPKEEEANVSSPHDSTEKILGFIEIEVSIKQIISNLNESRNKLIVFTFLFALVASMITYFSTGYLIGRPVRNLVEGTKRVAEGNFRDEIPPGRAELGLLSESFNKMQKQLVTTQSQLIESEKLASVGKLADEIANEINNPLTGIIVYSESLLSGVKSDLNEEDQSSGSKMSDIELIRQQALKIRESIKNILSFTKREKPVFADADAGRIISRAVSIVEKFSNFRNIKIINQAQKSLPLIQADHNLMEQVFLNLLLLSSDSMTSGGIINISSTVSENILEINFSDTGSGTSKNILKNIMEAGSPSGTGKEGISIAVCRNIIEMHKGRLDIDSAGAGNSITIQLPVMT